MYLYSREKFKWCTYVLVLLYRMFLNNRHVIGPFITILASFLRDYYRMLATFSGTYCSRSYNQIKISKDENFK